MTNRARAVALAVNTRLTRAGGFCANESTLITGADELHLCRAVLDHTLVHDQLPILFKPPWRDSLVLAVWAKR